MTSSNSPYVIERLMRANECPYPCGGYSRVKIELAPVEYDEEPRADPNRRTSTHRNVGIKTDHRVKEKHVEPPTETGGKDEGCKNEDRNVKTEASSRHYSEFVNGRDPNDIRLYSQTGADSPGKPPNSPPLSRLSAVYDPLFAEEDESELFDMAFADLGFTVGNSTPMYTLDATMPVGLSAMGGSAGEKGSISAMSIPAEGVQSGVHSDNPPKGAQETGEVITRTAVTDRARIQDTMRKMNNDRGQLEDGAASRNPLSGKWIQRRKIMTKLIVHRVRLARFRQRRNAES